MAKKIGRESLRKALIRQQFSGADFKSIYFHKFFNKVYEDGGTHSAVLYEDISGKMCVEFLANCTFTFCSDNKFIENLTEIEVESLLELSTETSEDDKLEVKLDLVNMIKKYAPQISEINNFTDRDLGYWSEGVVSGWKWKFKKLIECPTSELRDILTEFSIKEQYS